MMDRFVHIGYPKNFSTSLQRNYFSLHPEIFHLGIGIDSNLGYYDQTVEKTFELYLKTCKSFKYSEQQTGLADHFRQLFGIAAADKKVIGASSEHLSFSFSYDSLSFPEKMERLHGLFGSKAKIILVIRNQFDLIKSLFRESVRVGFSGNFQDYINLLYKYQDRNYLYDLRYDLAIEELGRHFDSKNIGVFLFEDYRAENGEMNFENGKPKIFNDLDLFLELESYDLDLGHFNKAVPDLKISSLAKLNANRPHDLGNHLLESAEKHRIKGYLEEDLNLHETEAETYSDVKTKNELIKQAAGQTEDVPLSYEANKDLVNWMKSFFENGNAQFESQISKSLSEKYFNLKF